MPITQEDLKMLAKQVDQEIWSVEQEIGPKIGKIFQFESDIVKGEFEKDFASFEGEGPKLQTLLLKHKKVFDELPPPEKGQTLVQMDLKLKKEFENSNLRTKC